MNVNFDALDKIPTMIELLKQVLENQKNLVDRKWLSTKQTAEYLGYSKDAIDKKVRENEFVEGTHYYQRASKRMFDKAMLDKWVVGIDMIDICTNTDMNNTINNIVKEFSA